MTDCICNIMHGLSPRRKLISTSFSDIFLRYFSPIRNIGFHYTTTDARLYNGSEKLKSLYRITPFLPLFVFTRSLFITYFLDTRNAQDHFVECINPFFYFFATRINLFNNFIFKNTLHLSISVTIIIV